MAIKKATTKKQRKKRVPIAGNRDILTVHNKEDGFVYRWVNDVDTRISKFKAAGYEIVDDSTIEVGEHDVKQASQLGRTVTKGVGKGVNAVLMRIEEEYYNEDQAAKAETVNATEETLNQNLNELDGKYGGIQIKR
jgi:hypothetical protein